jgi:hypothetical protein
VLLFLYILNGTGEYLSNSEKKQKLKKLSL